MLLDGLCRCYDAGLCRAVGLSNFGPRSFVALEGAKAPRGKHLGWGKNIKIYKIDNCIKILYSACFMLNGRLDNQHKFCKILLFCV